MWRTWIGICDLGQAVKRGDPPNIILVRNVSLGLLFVLLLLFWGNWFNFQCFKKIFGFGLSEGQQIHEVHLHFVCLGLLLLALSSNTCFESGTKSKIMHRHSNVAEGHDFNHS